MSNVVCPSGLSGVVRKLKAMEANLLADAAAQQRDTALDDVLRACWVETHDPGPYALKSGLLAWDDVLLADRFAVILALRVATYGPNYDFRVACSDDACRKRFEWSIHLRDDLKVIDLPASSRATFAAGNRFEGHFAGADKRFVFKLQDGKGERAAAKLLRAHRGRQLTVALASRIVEIDGVHDNDKLRFLDALDMDDVSSALAQMDAADGGVETRIEVRCEHCRLVQEIELPLGKDFWLPVPKTARAGSTSSSRTST